MRIESAAATEVDRVQGTWLFVEARTQGGINKALASRHSLQFRVGF
jgi:hypothetical protein